MTETNAASPRRPPEPIRPRERQLDPFPWYARMRAEAPVRYDEERGCWDVFRYADVRRVATDTETFSSSLGFEAGPADGDGPLIDFGDTMLRRDPPEHERLREVVDESFQPGSLRPFADDFADLADDRLDAVLADGSEFDFAAEFAAPIPAIVIAEVLGVPPEKRAPLVDLRGGDPEAFRDLKACIDELIEARRETPRDDVLSTVVHAEPGGRGMSDEEVYQFCALLLLAGSQTTITLLTSALYEFVERGLVEPIRRGEIDLDAAVEEVLRYRPPVHRVTRVTTEAVELAGETVPAGETVAAWIGSAHRDPERFDAPDEFRPERTPNRHMAFGGGIHFCLGAPLARLEARTVLPVVFDRLRSIEIAADDLDPIEGSVMYGFRTLPVSVRT